MDAGHQTVAASVLLLDMQVTKRTTMAGKICPMMILRTLGRV
jgi:hypothetical protein